MQGDSFGTIKNDSHNVPDGISTNVGSANHQLQREGVHSSANSCGGAANSTRTRGEGEVMRGRLVAMIWGKRVHYLWVTLVIINAMKMIMKIFLMIVKQE